MLFEAYTFNFEGSGNPSGGGIGRKNALNLVKMPISTAQPLPSKTMNEENCWVYLGKKIFLTHPITIHQKAPYNFFLTKEQHSQLTYGYSPFFCLLRAAILKYVLKGMHVYYFNYINGLFAE